MPRSSRTISTLRRPRAGSTLARDRRRVTQELRALAHPLRLRLLERFAQGRRTTMQVAAELGEPPTRLYHHVNALERAGLLKLRETRPNRGTTEKYYEVVRSHFGASEVGHLAGASGRAARGIATQLVETARGELLAALAEASASARTGAAKSGRAGTAAAEALPLAARMVVSLSPRQHAALGRRLVAALQKIGREFGKRAGPDVRTWAVTLAMAPTLAPGASGRSRPRRRRVREVDK